MADRLRASIGGDACSDNASVAMYATGGSDLTAAVLLNDPALKDYMGRLSDSVGGRWTISAAAIDETVPAPILSAALYERFSSRGDGDAANGKPGSPPISAARSQVLST